MLGSNILEIVFGLIFIYLLYSILATTIKEGVSAVLGLRAKMLRKAIRRMLDDGINDPHSIWAWFRNNGRDTWSNLYRFFLFIVPLKRKVPEDDGYLVNKFYNHPGIKYLGENRLYKTPSYISPAYFSMAVMDILKEMGTEENSSLSKTEKISAGIEKICDCDETKKLMRAFLEDANGDLDKFKISLEKWFNETMDRASGWYKKQTQKIIFIIGFSLAIVFNIDTIGIVKKLSKDKDARKALSEMAVSYYETHQDSTNLSAPNAKNADSLFQYAQHLLKTDINDATALIGLGWYIPSYDSCEFRTSLPDYENDLSNCTSCLREVTCGGDCETCTGHCGKNGKPVQLTMFQKGRYVICMAFSSKRKLLGFLITALAISFGAPFWFDLLGKMIQFRGAGKKPDGKTIEATATAEVKSN